MFGWTDETPDFTEPQQGADYATLLRVATATENLGFDAFFRSDHYLAMGGAPGLPGPTDSWVTLAGLALRTSGRREPRTGRGDGREAERGDQCGRPAIPGVRQQERPGAVVKREEMFCLDHLFRHRANVPALSVTTAHSVNSL